MGMSACQRCGLFAPEGAVQCPQCGAAVRPVGAMLVDEHYEIEKELRRTESTVLYRAYDPALDRHLLLKMLVPPFSADAAAVAEFRREATGLAAIHSDHTAHVHAFGTHGRSPFFVTDFVDGKSLERVLDEHLTRGARVSVRRTGTIVKDVARGLAAVHAAGLVHRGVRPSSITIENRTGRPVLVDFDLAVRAQDAGRAPLPPTVDPSYLAPELIDPEGGYDVGPRSDVYALACVAFEMLVGQKPYGAETLQQAQESVDERLPLRPSDEDRGLQAFDAVFERALAFHPADRFGSAPDFADAFARVAFAGTVSLDAAFGAPSGPSLGDGPLPEVSILIVDDDPDIRSFLGLAAKTAFHGLRYEVLSAATGVDALRLSARRVPDLLLLDYNMPGLDGVATLTRVRELPQGGRARAVVISAHLDDDVRWRFGALGVVDFHSKPIGVRQLMEVLVHVGGELKVRRRSSREMPAVGG